VLATNHHSQRGKKQIVVSCQWSVVSGQWAVGSGCRCGATHGVGPPIVADRWCHQTPIGRGGTRGGSLSWLGRGHLSGATQLSRDHPRPVGRENGMPVRGHPWRIWWRSGGATQCQSVNKNEVGDFRRGSECGPAAQPSTALSTAIRGQPVQNGDSQWGHPVRIGGATQHQSVAGERVGAAYRGWGGDSSMGPPTVRGHPWRIWWRSGGATQRRRGHPTPVGERNRQGRFAPRLGRRRRGHTRGHFPARLATG